MADTKENKELAKRQPTPSERFAASVERQFSGEVGQLNMTDYERTLAQHLFICVDAALIEAEKKRQYKGGNGAPIIWQNVNMRKLAIDAVNRVRLGLDALIPGTVYPIAYFNGKTSQYDMDLRIGYKGEIFYIQQASMRRIMDLRVELVYSGDEFTVYKKGVSSKVEGYDFKVNDPFERGELVGGFAYIEYEDERGNELIVMSKAEIDKIRDTSKSNDFWNAWYEEMAYKTLVHKAARRVTIDPHKINVTAYASVNAEEGVDRPALLDATPPLDELPPLELPQEEATVGPSHQPEEAGASPAPRTLAEDKEPF